MKRNKKIIIISFLIAAVLAAAICFYTLRAFNYKNLYVFYAPAPLEKKFAKIMFVGDLMFDRGIRYYAQKNGGNSFIFEKISPELLNNDLVVANLEGPITDEKSISAGSAPGSKNNYFFTFDPSLAKTLFENNIKIVNLGNNHILNFHTAGLKSTENYLTEAKVSYFGSPEGSRSLSKEIKGLRIAFISYNEFYGDIDLEQKSVIGEIKNLKEKSDFIVVFCHWGEEYAAAPADALKELAHKFIDEGADFIVGSHSHVIGPMEIYKGKRIYYSLGNFIFDQYFSEDVRRGLGVTVKIDLKTKQLDFEEKQFYLQSGGQTILVEKNDQK